MDRGTLAYWESLSSSFHFSPPLTPAEEDLAWYREQAGRSIRTNAALPRALLLGVTPGIATLQWPGDTQLVSVDWSEGMLRNVLPDRGDSHRRAAVRGDWRELPLASASCDVAFCDLFFPAMPSFGDAALALGEVARALRPGGQFNLRCVLRVDPAETAPELIEEYLRGPGGNFSLFRMRLAAAVQGTSSAGVALGDAWEAWSRAIPRLQALAPERQQETTAINRWKSLKVRYAFPTLAELRGIVKSRFAVAACELPAYAGKKYMARLALCRR